MGNTKKTETKPEERLPVDDEQPEVEMTAEEKQQQQAAQQFGQQHYGKTNNAIDIGTGI